MTTLRIALAYFSFVPLQLWLNWIFLPALGVGLLTGILQEGSPHVSGGTMTLCMLSIALVVITPAFGGGALLRLASSPLLLHLRPNGRREMLQGSTLTITLVAALTSLPALVFEMIGLAAPGKATAFGISALAMFGFIWGGTALVWVAMFALSKHQGAFVASFILLVVTAASVAEVVARLPVTAEQVAFTLFAAGVAAWIALAIWYMNARSVARPGWLGLLASGQSPAPGGIDAGNWFRRMSAGNAAFSRPTATYHVLMGTNSPRTQFMVGLAITMLLVIVQELASRKSARDLPVSMLTFFTLLCASQVPLIVRRARLLWLRAGMDRKALFAEAQRHAFRSAMALFAAPMAIFIPMSLAQRPDQAAAILLYAAMQATAATCFIHAGLAVTRKWWSPGSGIIFLVLGPLFVIVAAILQPKNESFFWAYVPALVLFGALAFGLRWYALRGWRVLDWRVAGPALPSHGRRGV